MQDEMYKKILLCTIIVVQSRSFICHVIFLWVYTYEIKQ